MNLFDFIDNMRNYPVVKFVDDLSNELEANPIYKALLAEQWEKGIDGNDQQFPVYSYVTELFSKYEDPTPIRPKIANEPYNLMWTGDLFNKTGMFVQTDNGDLFFMVDSSSDHKDSLETLLLSSGKEYDIFKLANEGMTKFILAAQEAAIDLLNTNLKF